MTRSTTVALVVAAASLVPALRAQELTPPSRLSGPWQIDLAHSASAFTESGDAEKKRASDGQPLPNDVKALIDVMRQLVLVPPRLTITATPDAVTFVDQQGVMQRFTADNKPERVSYGSRRVSVRTHWDEFKLVQDMTGDAIELSRTFTTAVDGRQLTLTIEVRRIPDESLSETFGQLPASRTYTFIRP